MTSGCKSQWPNALCQTCKGTVCPRPANWCGVGAAYFYLDCDDDGIPDPVCSTLNGQFGVIESSNACESTWPSGVCKSKAGNSCPRGNNFCGQDRTFTMIDCDADGIPDQVCTDASGNLGVLKSSSSCQLVWPNAISESEKGTVCS
uniref:Uncharacterized protein n=1 Tax=Clytia hemisphaerica TaxID=252671 RepID=A0A7M5X0Z8_9CNID